MMTPGLSQESFLKLIDSHKGIIVKIAATYCQETVGRDDLIQEIIYTLWKNKDKYKSGFKFSTWMYKVALNVAISFYRLSKKQRHIETTGVLPEIITTGHQETDITEQNYKLLQTQISALNELDRALIVLYFEERPYKEIAEIMGITETNVATKLSRIKLKITQQLQHVKNVQ